MLFWLSEAHSGKAQDRHLGLDQCGYPRNHLRLYLVPIHWHRIPLLPYSTQLPLLQRVTLRIPREVSSRGTLFARRSLLLERSYTVVGFHT